MSQPSPCCRTLWPTPVVKSSILILLMFAIGTLAGCGKGVATISAVAADGTADAGANSAPDAKPSQPPPSEPMAHPFPQRAVAPGLDGGQEWLNTSGPST